jgi:hypothetical protein
MAMNTLKYLRANVLLCLLLTILQPLYGIAQGSDAARISNPPVSAKRDGQHDFVFEIGTWKTHLKRLQRPLTGSTSFRPIRISFGGKSIEFHVMKLDALSLKVRY